MDFIVNREAVCVNDQLYEGSIEQSVDSEITLPDYCPNIQSILKCTVTPSVAGTQGTGDRITVEGSACVRMLYLTEEDKLNCFEQTVPFSRYVEVKNLSAGACLSAHIHVEYVNCRAISPRRADIHGAMSINIRARVKKNEEVIAGVEGAGVQLRRRTCEASTLVADVERIFSLSEVQELGQSNPSIAQVLRYAGNAFVKNVKTVSNKLLVTGELNVQVFYLSDTEEKTIEHIEHVIPISQIVECEGITEDSICSLHLETVSLEVQPKADSDGIMNLLDISARVCAVAAAWRTVEIPLINDAYSTQYELAVEQQMMNFDRLIEVFEDTTLCRSSVDLSGEDVKQILSIWCGDITSGITQKERGLFLQGAATICMLVRNTEGRFIYLERQVDYEYRREIKSDCERIKCEPYLIVSGLDYVLSAGERLDLRMEINICASVFSMHSDKLITSLTPNEEQPKRNLTAALTIYYSDAGESVWDIARRYNTTVEAILQENKLTDETVTEKCMLLIPSV